MHLTPDYIFESSWEVCNKVGGIYTVLSSRAKTLQDRMKDKIIFIAVNSPLRVVAPTSVKGFKSICIERAEGPLSIMMSMR